MSDQENNPNLIKLIETIIQQDQTLRDQYQIGDKFRFIRERLLALQENVTDKLAALASMQQKEIKTLAEDETFVFVHLFNAQGIVLTSWHKMLNPAVFYEYSINRPIFDNKQSIEQFIRSKTNKNQHGYLTVAVKKTDILPPNPEEINKQQSDSVKVREGSLNSSNLYAFTHNGIDYELNEDGELVKIDTSESP